MKCREAMLETFFTCRPDTTAEACAQLMRDEGIGFVPVVDARGQVLGVVTDRDLVLRVLAARRPESTPLSQVMTPGPFIACHAGDDLGLLEQRMANARKSRALVLDDRGHLEGIISLSDIAQVEPSAERVGEVVRELTDRESSLLSDI